MWVTGACVFLYTDFENVYKYILWLCTMEMYQELEVHRLRTRPGSD